MKRNRFFMSLAAAISLLGLVSCERLEEVDVIVDSEVSFSATTESDPESRTLFDPETRTVFSGSVTGSTTTTEKINWVVGDKFRVYSPQALTPQSNHYADYTVKTVSSDASVASVVKSPYPLRWSKGTNTFYAVYPAAAGSTSAATVTGTIPSAQTVTVEGTTYKADLANRGYMYAYSSVSQYNSNVSLSFKSMFNSFEFTLRSSSTTYNSGKLTKITLSSNTTNLAGTFTTNLNSSGGYATPTVTNGQKTVSASISGGVTLPTSGGIKITLLTLPISQTQLTLTLEFDNGKKLTQQLKDSSGNWLTVGAGKKFYYSNTTVNNNWVYTLEWTPTTLEKAYNSTSAGNIASGVKSYKSNGVSNVAVPFKLQYQTPDGRWLDAVPSWITMPSSNNLSGSVSGVTLQASVKKATNSVVLASDAGTKALRNATPKTDYDLSLFRPSVAKTASGGWDNPKTSAADRRTANCYVVYASGTYKFPMVYGNSLHGSSAYDKSYKYQGSDGDLRMQAYQELTNGGYHTDRGVYSEFLNLTTFLGHDGGGITTPFIANKYSSLTASLLWTDVPGLITKVAISGSGSSAYITFSVPQDTIAPGNAVIVVKSGGTVVWSWHIWVTSYNLASTTAVGGSYQMAPAALGACNYTQQIGYAGYSCKVRLVQSESNKTTSNTATITRKDGTTYTEIGRNALLYEWGRKDPLFNEVTNKKYYNGSGTAISLTKQEVGDGPNITSWRCGIFAKSTYTLSLAIKNPTVYYYSGNQKGAGGHNSETLGGGEWACNTYRNLWDNNPNSSIVKTVYDPSPVGFIVPPHTAIPASTLTDYGYRDYKDGTFKASSGWYWTSDYIAESEWFQRNSTTWTDSRYGFTNRASYAWHVKHPYNATALTRGTSSTSYSSSILSYAYPIRPVVDTGVQ